MRGPSRGQARGGDLEIDQKSRHKVESALQRKKTTGGEESERTLRSKGSRRRGGPRRRPPTNYGFGKRNESGPLRGETKRGESRKKINLRVAEMKTPQKSLLKIKTKGRSEVRGDATSRHRKMTNQASGWGVDADKTEGIKRRPRFKSEDKAFKLSRGQKKKGGGCCKGGANFPRKGLPSAWIREAMPGLE